MDERHGLAPFARGAAPREGCRAEGQHAAGGLQPQRRVPRELLERRRGVERRTPRPRLQGRGRVYHRRGDDRRQRSRVLRRMRGGQLVSGVQVRPQAASYRPFLVPSGPHGDLLPLQEHPPLRRDARQHARVDGAFPLLRRTRHPQRDDRRRPDDRQLRRLLHRLHAQRHGGRLHDQDGRRRLRHPRELQAAGPRRTAPVREPPHLQLRRLELLLRRPLRHRHGHGARRRGRELPLPRNDVRRRVHAGLDSGEEGRVHREHPRVAVRVPGVRAARDLQRPFRRSRSSAPSRAIPRTSRSATARASISNGCACGIAVDGAESARRSSSRAIR